jgi:urea transport system substrate-binding protein
MHRSDSPRPICGVSMHSEQDAKEQPLTRRELLKRGAGALGLVAMPSLASLTLYGCERSAPREYPIKVGILHSQTGTMAISEISLRDMELMAIEEINAGGGVLGRPIEPVIEDTRSRFTDLFPKKAAKLLREDKVAAVFGCWTSVSRKAVLPVFEEHNGLLFYPVQYEGNECSRHVIYTGSAPNQQILPAIDWLMGAVGGARKRFYLLGSDYIYPRTANHIVGKYVEYRGAEVVGIRYTPLGHRDYTEIIDDIAWKQPDVVFSTLNGDTNVYFYQELARRGITAEQLPVVATSVGEDELRGLLSADVQGHLAAWSYFQSIDTPANRAFVERFQGEHGEDRVVSDPMEAAYSQVYLWKLAVEKAGSIDVDRVREAFASGIEFEAPGGRIKVDPKTYHTYKHFRMGRIRDDRQFSIVYESPKWIEPEPYPQIAFPGWQCDWTQGGMKEGAEIPVLLP